MELKEKMPNQPLTAIVTGGSRGIGAAVAVRLISDGFRVNAPGRDEMDLSDLRSVRSWAETVEPTPDALVLNAGENIPARLEDVTTEHWLRTLDVNLNSCFELIRAFGPRMVAKGSGRIVAISSCFSFRGRAGRGPYAASKAGLNSLVRVAALEYGSGGVLVNTVCPGFVMTDLTRQNNDEDAIAQLAAGTALGRLGEPEEIAELVAFLVGTANSYVTGQALTIDGGYSCQ